jgi:hypothetical protein
LQILGLAHSIKRVHFNRASSAWQLVSSRVKNAKVGGRRVNAEGVG